MIDSFVGVESDFLECFRDVFLLAPVDIPIVILSLAIVAIRHGAEDAVGEKGFEFNL